MTICNRCGKVLHPDSIHTCSPQVAAPSGWLTMTEDEFAAMSRRFAAATDYPTHRSAGLPQTVVECSDVADVIAELHAQRGRAVAAEERANAMVSAISTEANERLGIAESRAVALRQLAEEAITMLAEWDESMAGVPSFGHGDGTTAKDLAARLAEIGGGE